MNFIYFTCEFYRISNAFTNETLILNYNGESNLGICFLFLLKFTYSCYDSQTYFYIYNFKNIFI